MRSASWTRPARSLPVLMVAVASTVVVLAFGAGVASAVPVVNCDLPGGSAAFQAALTGGGSVFVSGHCVGVFTAPVSVTVTGSPSATLDGGGAGRTLTISPGTVVTLNALTVTGGNVTGAGPAGSGGGIFNNMATLTLNSCVVTANTASSAGGGISSGGPPAPAPPSGKLTLNSSRVTNNVALGIGGGGGGGILSHNSTAVLNNSVVSGNSGSGGGGIASGAGNFGPLSGSITITGSQISGNTAFGGPDGGAGGIANGGTLTLTNSSVTGNHAVGGVGGGIFNHGTATITGSLISGNAAPNDTVGDQGNGGGITNANFGVDGTGVMTISNSQVTKNQSGGGGGIFNGAFGGDTSMTLTGTAVSFNSVTGQMSGGGGILNLGFVGAASLTVTGSTLVGNLARQGLGGAIANANQGGEADVSIASTTIGSTTPVKPYTLNPNQAQFGGGIFNWAFAGPASVSLGSGTLVVGNQATVDGGGVFNADGASLLTFGATILLNHPDNIANDPNF